jgi:SNF2 family DNA or RNA helicase
MGLGKTIQVLALLLVLHRQSEQRQSGGARRPSLLVAPASLLANWAAEMERFAPSLKAIIAHPSELPASDLKSMTAEQLRNVDVVITSYGTLLRVPWLAHVSWNLVVLDEAQAIKNPSASRARRPRN